MRRRIAILTLLALALVAGLAALCWPQGAMASRDIGCANAAPGRGQEICRALSASMQWTWMGHAIVAPGFRVTWDGLARVWCATHITDADLPALEALRRASDDWRLESSASNLILILKNRDGAGGEPENSIFHPKNPSYILRNGCAKLK